MPSPQTQAANERLVAAIKHGEALVVAERDRVLADIRNEAGHRAVARLGTLRDTISNLQLVLDNDGTAWIRDALPAAYAEGASVALTDTGSSAVFTWTDVHTAAVQILARSTYENLLHVSVEAGRTSKVFQSKVRRAASELASRNLAQQTPKAAGRALARQLESDGLIGVTYANGAVHSVGSYMEMVARTETVMAYNTAALTEYESEDVGWLEVFDGPSCGWTSHDDPDKADGTVRSRSDCQAHPLAHPRCQRSFAARDDVTNARQAKLAAPSTTAAERADAAGAEQARLADTAGRAANRAAARRRAATLARHQQAGAA